MSARQQFGSICAEVNHGDGCVSILANGAVVHSIRNLQQANDLIAFWRKQERAPVSGAMIEALKWGSAKVAGYGGHHHGT